MTWEDAAKRFRTLDASTQGLSSLAGPQLSPAPLNSRGSFSQDAREMDLDTSPSQQHPPALTEARISRTPLPSGPRPEKHANMPPLPGFETFRADLQGSADRILANPFRSRYAHVSVLLVGWQDDHDAGAQSAIHELAKTFHEDYNYAVQVKSIPESPEGSRNPWLWLSQAVTDFVADHNQRDCLKIFYYSGYSYLDGNRDAVLARFVLLSAFSISSVSAYLVSPAPSTPTLPRSFVGAPFSSTSKTLAPTLCSSWTAPISRRTRRPGGKACWS
jgi:hypothetical protein